MNGRKAGRPLLPKDKKKVRVSLSLSRGTLDIVEKARGGLPRSAFIESAIAGSAVAVPFDVPSDRKANGAVYTPAGFADYVAGKVVAFFLGDLSDRPKTSVKHYSRSAKIDELRILDPACGNGQLLEATWNQLQIQSPLFRRSSLPHLLEGGPARALCGIDIDSKAIRKTKRRIEALATHPKRRARTFHLLTSNGLFPFNTAHCTPGWERVRRLFNAPNGFDIVIANPPWGANTSNYRSSLDNGDFVLYQGQYDTADLFVELALRVCRPNGYIALIMPDSLFSLERTRLREMLLKRSRLLFVGRFGEKIFDGVNRACAVIVCQNVPQNGDGTVQCLRLTPDVRQKILDGEKSFTEAEDALRHDVPQSRFLANKDYSFDIDVRVTDEHTIRCYRSAGSTLRDHLRSDRGVELSKHGWVYPCEKCSKWMPLPKSLEVLCQNCGSKIKIKQDRAVSIVSDQRIRSYSPLFVGENVRRYSLTPHLWIDTTKEGLNYKDPAIYKSPKILLRKTGVGISATIDYSTSLTNQVVYIFRTKEEVTSRIPLEFYLGVLNSRAMYYYLVKSHGETEWRSHPYVTQNQILDLPVPPVDALGKEHRDTVNIITQQLRKLLHKNQGIPNRVDAQVELLVADLYGLTREDYEGIYSTLDSVQELIPVRALKTVGISDIFD